MSATVSKAGQGHLSHSHRDTSLGLILTQAMLLDDSGAQAVPQRGGQELVLGSRDVTVVSQLVHGTEACLDLSARIRDMSIHGGTVTSASVPFICWSAWVARDPHSSTTNEDPGDHNKTGIPVSSQRHVPIALTSAVYFNSVERRKCVGKPLKKNTWEARVLHPKNTQKLQ